MNYEKIQHLPNIHVTTGPYRVTFITWRDHGEACMIARVKRTSNYI